MDAARGLSAVFLAHLGAASQGWTASAALEMNLQARFTTGAAAWPELDLTAPAFARHLAERLAEEADPEKGLDAVNAGDLYLACACQHDVQGAIETFDRSVLSHVPAFVR